MKPFIFCVLLFAYGALAAAVLLPQNKYKYTAIGNYESAIFDNTDSASCAEDSASCAEDSASELRKRDQLEKSWNRDKIDQLDTSYNRDKINEWNRDHQNIRNQIAPLFHCPGLSTPIDDMSVWDAFQQALWYMHHKELPLPVWRDREFPHPIWLPPLYHSPPIGVGEAYGNLFAFPLNPGLRFDLRFDIGAFSRDHCVIFDDRGVFAGVAVIDRGNGEVSEEVLWCHGFPFPTVNNAVRDVGGTAEGVPGVDKV